jgi:hypothetical protein
MFQNCRAMNPILKKLTKLAIRNAVADYGADSHQAKNHKILLERMSCSELINHEE